MFANHELIFAAPRLYSALESTFPKEEGWRWDWLYANEIKVRIKYVSKEGVRHGLALELSANNLDASQEILEIYIREAIKAIRRQICAYADRYPKQNAD